MTDTETRTRIRHYFYYAAGVTALAGHLINARGAQPRVLLQSFADEGQVGIRDRGSQGLGLIESLALDEWKTKGLKRNALFIGERGTSAGFDERGDRPQNHFGMAPRVPRSAPLGSHHQRSQCVDEAFTLRYRYKLDPEYKVYEYACHEGNYMMLDALQGAHDLEDQGRDAKVSR